MKKLLSFFTLLLAIVLQSQAQIVISEIMYNPPESGTDSLEFVEFYNNSVSIVDMTGYTLTSGVTYTFPAVSMAAGSYYVIAVDSQKFVNFYGVPCNGDFGGGLSNNGEIITLEDGTGTFVDSVRYDDATPWVTTPDGDGPSLELCDANSDNNDGNNWSASTNFVGIVNSKTVYASPGAPNCTGTVTPVVSFTTTSIVVNEADGTASFGVGITNADTNTVSVDIHIEASSTAINPDDYVFADTTVTFQPLLDTTYTFTITITDDTIFEPTDTLTLSLQNLSPAAMMGDSVLNIVLTDDDATIDYGDCLNLFISEYIEGSGYNKALELYNPTNQTIDLSNYSLQRFGNTDTTASAILNLNGTIQSGATFVIMNSGVDTAYIGQADMTTNFINHNGNDAYLLFNYTDTIDVFGTIGGTANFDIDTVISGAKDHTLVRKADIHKGSLNWVTGNMEWDIYAQNDFSHIGSHTMNSCQVNIQSEQGKFPGKIFPNPFDREIIYEGKIISRIQILDITGKVVYENNQINTHRFVIKDVCFRPGLYFIKAFDGEGNILIQKIMKK
ncbi:MAG: lamin tail domain-containing protein [Bacteroidales bacterium]|nr:lamin tail domain-containing protein [Bacteroidales bacterium]